MTKKKLSELGLRILKNDTQLRDEDRLYMEIMARCPEGITEKELYVWSTQLSQTYGSAAAAVEALKRNEVKITADPEFQQLIDEFHDFTDPSDIEELISGILERSDSPQEIAERTKTLVTMLVPESAHAVFWRACMVASAKAYDIECDDCDFVPHFDAVLNGLTPWLRKHGYPEPHAFPAMKS